MNSRTSVPGLFNARKFVKAFLADIYGQQQLLQNQVLPPEIIFQHPGFTGNCTGITPAGGRWLSEYAVDLIRAPDGTWNIVRDHAQTPVGLGYAVENRLVSARVYQKHLSKAVRVV